MCKADTLEGLNDSGVIGIIRVSTAQDLIRIARALREGGLSCLEITMTSGPSPRPGKSFKKRCGPPGTWFKEAQVAGVRLDTPLSGGDILALFLPIGDG